MSDDSNGRPAKPTLLERLSAFLSREPDDREELLKLLHGAFEHKLLDADALSIIEGALQVSEMTVRDIMIPRAQMDVVSIEDEPAAVHTVRAGNAALALSGDRREQGRRRRHPAGEGAAQLLRESGKLRPARHAAPGRVRAGIEAAQRAAARLSRQSQPHRDRRRRIRRRLGPGDDRGRARADRRRHRGRVRLRREPRTTSSPRRTAAIASRRRPRSPTSTRSSAAISATRSSTPSADWCCRRSAACRSAAKRRRSATSAFASSAPTAAGSTRCRSEKARRRRLKSEAPNRGAQALGRAARAQRHAARRALAACGDARSVFGFAPFGAWRRLAADARRTVRAVAARRNAARRGVARLTRSASACSAPATSWIYVALSTFGGMPRRFWPRSAPPASARISRCFRRWRAGSPHGSRRRARRRVWRSPRAPGRSPNGCTAPGIRAFPGSRSAMRRSAARSQASRRSAACSWSASPSPQPLRCWCTRRRRWSAAGTLPRSSVAAAIAAIAVGGIALARSRMDASQPASRSPSASCRATSTQDLKFDPAYREKSLAIYAELAERAKGRLIVLPESALPMFADEVPDESDCAPARDRGAQRRRSADRLVLLRAARGRGGRGSLLQQRRQPRHRADADLSQAPSGAVRRDRFRRSRSSAG